MSDEKITPPAEVEALKAERDVLAETKAAHLEMLKRAHERNTTLRARVAALEAALRVLVDEFGCTIEQYHKNGPDWTHKDGTEVFEVSTILDRAPLIEAARAALEGNHGAPGHD